MADAIAAADSIIVGNVASTTDGAVTISGTATAIVVGERDSNLYMVKAAIS